MKINSILLCSLCSLVTYSTHAQQNTGPIYKQFGKMAVNVSKPHKLNYLHGKISSVNNGIVTLDIYKSVHYGGYSANSQQAVGAYSAGSVGGYSEKEFDRTVAITNSPDLNDATIGKQITVNAMRIGTLTVQGDPLEFYDCGTPYVPPPPTPEQIQAAQVVAKARTAAEKEKAEQAAVKALAWQKELAANGDSYGLRRMAERYRDGDGVEKDVDKSAEYFKKADAAAVVQANNAANEANQETKLKEQAEKRQKIASYEALSNKGSVTAMIALGKCYRDGDGVEKDVKKAKEIFQKAAGTYTTGFERARTDAAELISTCE